MLKLLGEKVFDYDKFGRGDSSRKRNYPKISPRNLQTLNVNLNDHREFLIFQKDLNLKSERLILILDKKC